MERDVLIVTAILGVIFCSVPLLILFVSLYSKGRATTSDQGSTEPLKLAPHIAEALSKMEQMRTNPFPNIEDLNVALKGYDKGLVEELPPFSHEILEKDLEEEARFVRIRNLFTESRVTL